MQQQITFSQLHAQIAPEIKLRAWQIRCKNKFGSYNGGRIATPEEIEKSLKEFLDYSSDDSIVFEHLLIFLTFKGTLFPTEL